MKQRKPLLLLITADLHPAVLLDHSAVLRIHINHNNHYSKQEHVPRSLPPTDFAFHR